MKSAIQHIHARQILDSRGFPTVECQVTLADGTVGSAAVPSGASTGENEAVELRDGDKKYYRGKGVTKAVDHVNAKIATALKGLNALDQSTIDRLMIDLDGTPNKAALGANAMLAVSLANAQASAAHTHQPLYKYLGGEGANTLPAPMLNILNGGKHADNTVDFQEFMIQPIGFDTFQDALRAGVEIYHCLKDVLHEKHLSTAVGDEGGFAPNLKRNEDACDLIAIAVEKSGYELGRHIMICLDPAASELVNEAKKVNKNGYKFFKSDPNRVATSDEMIHMWSEWSKRWPIRSIEDGLGEDDWSGWKSLTTRMGKTTQLVGDDLFVTNPKFLSRGITEHCANAILVKVNQIGTLTETLEAVAMAQKASFNVILSHRSGETEDHTIADLAVATNCGQIKTGAPCRSDRTAKYNRLLRIAEELGTHAQFGGTSLR